MTTEFSWWVRDSGEGKFRVKVSIHGGAISWERQPARFSSWEPYVPTQADWDRLVEDARRRVPRRLLSPRQFEEIARLRGRAAG